MDDDKIKTQTKKTTPESRPTTFSSAGIVMVLGVVGVAFCAFAFNLPNGLTVLLIGLIVVIAIAMKPKKGNG